jgi:hypothetical protein
MKQSYSVWKQVSYYQKGAIDTSKEVLPVHSLLAINPKDERHFELKDDVVNFNMLMHNIETGNITQLDKTIVCIVAFSEYSTTKQISELLTLMGINFSENMLNSSIKRLHKNTLILISRIADANVKIVSLDKNGSEIAKRLDVPHTWNAFQRVDEPWKVKTILCCNQLRNAYLKSNLPIKWFKVREKLSVNDITIRPSFATQISGTILLFEVVRQREGWKDIFMEKVSRYAEVLQNFEDNSWHVNGGLRLVVNGENFQHNYEIYKALEEVNSEILPSVLFTEDLLQFGERFKKSLYTISEDGTAEYLQFNM